jgi:hypothetical protein
VRKAHLDTVEPTPTETSDDRPRRLSNGIRLGAVLAVGFAVAFFAWLILDTDDTSSVAGSTVPTATTPTPTQARPAITSVAELRKAAESTAVPIYWVGARRGTLIEFTRAPDGSVIVRYLPPTTQAGVAGSFLTIATYPRQNGYREVLTSATEPNAKTIKLAGGGIAVYKSDEPTNFHVAYPGQPYQIEVFAPERGLARRLVSGGAVRPVG